MKEIASLIIPSIASGTVVMVLLYYFLTPKSNEGWNPKVDYIIFMLFSIIFFIASIMISIILKGAFGGYLFVIGCVLLLGSILLIFLNRPVCSKNSFHGMSYKTRRFYLLILIVGVLATSNIIAGFLFAICCVDYPDIVSELPSDSIPVPTGSVPISTDSITAPNDSVTVSTDSITAPNDSVTVSTDSITAPNDSVTVSTDSIPAPTDFVPVSIDSIPAPTDFVPVSIDSIPVSAPTDNASGTPDLFIIYNEDSNNSHEVAIEIFNSDNESIFRELYIIDKNEWIKHPKEPMITTSYSRLYTFKVVLDNETSGILETKIDPWTTLTIFLYSKSPDYGISGEIIPLEILAASE